MNRCVICGRVMSNEFDGMNVVSTCYNENCHSVITVPQKIDDKATERFWNEIDRERINENPAWLDELRAAGLCKTV